MHILSTVKNFKSFDEKEERHKESFIQFLENFDQSMWATRDNLIGHLSSSAWVTNKNRDKVIFAYHNIYDSWAWLGGHADGDLELLNVAIKESKEEAGLKEVKVILDKPIALEALFVQPHMKRGKFIPDHLHFNFTYLLEANEDEILEFRPDESSDVAWINISDVLDKTSEPHMKESYQRVIDKIKTLNI